MSVCHNTISYIRVNSFKFQNILEEYPAVSDLYDRAIRIIDNSVFKDKITPSIWIDKKDDKKTFWMSLATQDLISEDLKFAQDHQEEWEALIHELSLEKVTVDVKGGLE